MVNNLCNVVGTAEIPNLTIPWTLRWCLCVVDECTRKMKLTRSTPYTYMSITRIQTKSITEENRASFHSLVDSFTTPEYPCLAASWCDSLVRGTRDPRPAASKRFPIVLGDTAGETCARISSLDYVRAANAARIMHRSWRASVLRGRLRIWECSTDPCWN